MAHSKRDSGKSSKAWQAYEEATLYVLKEIREHFHLVEIKGKQEVLGQESGTRWKLDVMGVRDGDGAVIIVECRRRRSRLSQEAIAAVAYRIIDAGAAGGITVSPEPLQKDPMGGGCAGWVGSECPL